MSARVNNCLRVNHCHRNPPTFGGFTASIAPDTPDIGPGCPGAALGPGGPSRRRRTNLDAMARRTSPFSGRNPWRFTLVAVAAVLLAAGCSSGSSTAESDPSTNLSSTSTTAAASSTSLSLSTTSTTSEASSSTVPDSDQSDAATCTDRQPGSTGITVTEESVTYTVQVFVPSAYGSGLTPAVINWHGLGSTGQQQAFLTDYENLAESEGFVVVHPTGVSNDVSGDARGWELAQFDTVGRDDVAMAEVLIDQLIDDFCVDPNRVYSTGMSNGGFFTSRLVCEMADRIAAAVSVGGISHYDECRPDRPVPFMAFHGTDDGVVPFAGGESSLASPESPPALQAFFDQVMPDEFAEFSTDFGCATTPAVTEVTPEVIRYDYTGCDGDVPMTFIEIVGGGHTWPGSPLGPLMEGFVGVTTDDISATAAGWAFMSQFSLENEQP